jgi:uncharacterized membrane protein
MKRNANLKAIAIGIIAGIRSMSAPAIASTYLAAGKNSADSRFGILASPAATTLLKLLAAGEIIADKLPIVPARVSAAPLIARVASGAISAAVACAASRKRVALGAALGGIAALVGVVGFYVLRRTIASKTNLPDPMLGVAEDARVIGGTRTVLGRGKSV